MTDEVKTSYIKTCAMFIAFAAFTLLVMLVDVQAIGPEGTSVGFATFNKAVQETFPYNEVLYNISKYAGYLVLAVAGCFALYGVLMLIVRKSFKKVDKDIYVLAGFYAIILVVYVAFDKIAINYRPVILDEGIEPSYPSTHTMLAITILTAAMIEFDMRVKSKRLLYAVEAFSVLLMLVVIVFRFISGVHWATDVAGSVILGIALSMLFSTVIKQVTKK